MNKNTVITFNKAFAFEPTKQEAQLINDMLAVWGKLEPNVGKTPATIRKGIIFGMGLASALAAGEIVLPEVREKAVRKGPSGRANHEAAE